MPDDTTAPVTAEDRDGGRYRLSLEFVAANDPQKGFTSSGPGKPEDRNVELVVKAPFAVARAAVRASSFAVPRSGAGIAGALAIGSRALRPSIQLAGHGRACHT